MNKILTFLIFFGICANAQYIDDRKPLIKLPAIPKVNRLTDFTKCVVQTKKTKGSVKYQVNNYIEGIPEKLNSCLVAAKAHKLVKAGANINVEKVCAMESKESECQDSFTKKIEDLGCDHSKIATHYQIANGQPLTKLYFVSEKCQTSANNKNCSAGYNARYLDAEKKDIICIKVLEGKSFNENFSSNEVNK